MEEAIEEVARRKLKLNKAADHLQEAEDQMDRAEKLLAEAEAHLQSVKIEQKRRAPSPPSGPSSSIGSAVTSRLEEGIRTVGDMLRKLLAHAPEDGGQLVLPQRELAVTLQGIDTTLDDLGLPGTNTPIMEQRAPPLVVPGEDAEMEPEQQEEEELDMGDLQLRAALGQMLRDRKRLRFAGKKKPKA